MRARIAIAALGCATLAVGCLDALEEVSEVRDLRVLAMRAEPPEVMYDLRLDPITGQPVMAGGVPILDPSTDEVTFDALVVDPRGGSVGWRWDLCPIQSSEACHDYERQRDSIEEEVVRDVLDDLRDVSASGLADPPVDPDAGVPSYGVGAFSLTLPVELIGFHLAQSGAGAGFGAWPSVNLTVTKPTESLEVEKRFVLSLAPRTVGMLAELADSAGGGDVVGASFDLRFCAPGQDPPPGETCLRLQPRGPNQNPVFDQLSISYGKSANAVWQPLISPVTLRAGESIRILPTFTGDSAEPYQEMRADLDTRQISLVDLVEEMSVSWFASAGHLQDTSTWRLFTKTLDTIYQAPVDIPEDTGGRVTLWLVARDQRGGVAWTTVEVQVVLPSEEIRR